MITWDERRYELGLDRGVIYLPDGSSAPWNGLTALDETLSDSATSFFLDGVKFVDVGSIGDFAATLSAVTYPPELDEIVGVVEVGNGWLTHDQPHKTFSLSYRTLVNEDKYKIHLVYNLMAASGAKLYSTIADQVNLSEFSWNLVSVPEKADGVRPTAHVILDGSELAPPVVGYIEQIIYGTDSASPRIPSLAELLNLFTLIIIDNGDGSWSAIGSEALVHDHGDGSFEIDDANATYIDADTYDISSGTA